MRIPIDKVDLFLVASTTYIESIHSTLHIVFSESEYPATQYRVLSDGL